MQIKKLLALFSIIIITNVCKPSDRNIYETLKIDPEDIIQDKVDANDLNEGNCKPPFSTPAQGPIASPFSFTHQQLVNELTPLSSENSTPAPNSSASVSMSPYSDISTGLSSAAPTVDQGPVAISGQVFNEDEFVSSEESKLASESIPQLSKPVSEMNEKEISDLIEKVFANSNPKRIKEICEFFAKNRVDGQKLINSFEKLAFDIHAQDKHKDCLNDENVLTIFHLEELIKLERYIQLI